MTVINPSCILLVNKNQTPPFYEVQNPLFALLVNKIQTPLFFMTVRNPCTFCWFIKIKPPFLYDGSAPLVRVAGK